LTSRRQYETVFFLVDFTDMPVHIRLSSLILLPLNIHEEDRQHRSVPAREPAGQFILSRDPTIIPDHWSRYEKAGWYLGVNGLPAVPVSRSRSTRHHRYLNCCKIGKEVWSGVQAVPVQLVSDEGLLQWLDITGYALGGEIWKIHKSLQGFDRHRVMLPGIAGEVGRAFYWRDGDSAGSNLSAETLMMRAGLSVNGRILQATSDWLDGLSGYNAYQVLDLFYLEQRLGCWAGPQHYGNTTSVFELSPFNHRRIFTAMMQLPYQYRLDQQLANDVCRQEWPALLKYPVNRYTRLDRLGNLVGISG
jgi:hypothetical protein